VHETDPRQSDGFSTESQFILDLIQQIAGREAFRRGLFNLRHKAKLPNKDDPPGTVIEAMKDQLNRF